MSSKWQPRVPRLQRRPENHAVLYRVGTSTSAGRCSQRLMEWKCVHCGFSCQQKVPLLALRTEFDQCSSNEPRTMVLGCFQPSSTTPPRPGSAEEWAAIYGHQRPGTQQLPSPGKLWHEISHLTHEGLAVNSSQAFGPGTCPTSMIRQGVRKKRSVCVNWQTGEVWWLSAPLLGAVAPSAFHP